MPFTLAEFIIESDYPSETNYPSKYIFGANTNDRPKFV